MQVNIMLYPYEFGVTYYGIYEARLSNQKCSCGEVIPYTINKYVVCTVRLCGVTIFDGAGEDISFEFEYDEYDRKRYTFKQFELRNFKIYSCEKAAEAEAERMNAEEG